MKQGPNNYGVNDVKILSHMLQAKKAAVGGRKLTAREREELLEELDRKTGRTT